MTFNKDFCLRNYLDLSTTHMPNSDPDWGDVRVAEHEWGFIAFIDPDLNDVPEWLKETFDFAISLKCDIINFDSDANIIESLPTWDW